VDTHFSQNYNTKNFRKNQNKALDFGTIYDIIPKEIQEVRVE
jgi:hypothetical protein